ncbi:methyltransferase family protein [Sphingomonas jatrophae]|uniref:methyltransferase family protein n=1 Tax=Sphingomonas jatrophae TaxID=1166337 RepID=UPI003BF9528A
MATRAPHGPGPDIRPRSAVSTGVGLAGMAGLGLWLAAAIRWGMDGPYAAMSAVIACGVPMILWSLLIDRVHRNPTTGIDWSAPPRPWRESLDVSIVKLVGLWATWGVIAAFYFVGRWYWQGQYLFAMAVLQGLVPWLVALSVPYVLWLDRKLVEPRDGAWHFGLMLLGRGALADRARIVEHARSWAVKGFFTAFMISIVPGNWMDVVQRSLPSLSNPAALASWLIAVMFLIDVAFATVGYLLTMRPLDSHIRSANPYAAGWTAALICYPPFILMNAGGPLDYHSGGAEWGYWFEGSPRILGAIGLVLAALTAVYAWATVAFGLRFSNLTHRGILTHGPYALTKHPAYLAKNVFWWISSLPMLTTTNSWSDAVRNTAILAAVSGVYYWRARTEERHLSADPDYVAYAAWARDHAPVPRFFGWLGRGLGLAR